MVNLLKLKKAHLKKFLNKLKNEHKLYVPVKTDLVRFEEYKGDIYLKENSYFPIKEFFFKKEETLFDYNKNKISVPEKESEKRIFFGVRRCDLNAIKHQDMIFIEKFNDPYYKKERENSILIGYHCNTAPSEFCFCGSMDLKDCQDLMFFDKGSYFLVEISSKKGSSLIKKHKEFFKNTDKKITTKKIPNTDILHTKDISNLYNNPDWKKASSMCLSCSACTALCPTCYCHSIHDEGNVHNLNKGKRKRTWSSCQLKEFTKVAGGHVFREKREDRFKHRIYHQLEYFKERYGVNLCTGCGRCISGCPTRINWLKLVNEMKK
ncbi:4Fe-4S dicluster domain-containing protein [Candidatus Woesearchaeota archaeon]|nr:4Fe-4S dicluster domain-containing protein [Candidatus Woesearchaeota archaeon]